MQTNVLEYLEQTAPRVPDKVAYGNEDTEVTFGEVLRNAQAIGTFLKRQGHYKEPVVVFMRKHPERDYQLLRSGICRLLLCADR